MAISNEKERRELIAKALEAANKKADAERIRLPWRAGEHVATVVELPVAALVLNPKSHRIKAQLESSGHQTDIASDPFSLVSQSEIEDILRDSEQFKDLKQNLKDTGQLEPGVVTADGMLVNANTRCVALRDNDALYIRVAVLPEDADQREIDRLELALQMKRDFRSDYTYTNELLFVNDLIQIHHYKPDGVAEEMGWASPTDKGGLRKKADQVRQYLRILALIRELQHMSENRMQLVEFDANRQALSEIDDEIEALKKSDPSASREVRDARLAAMLSNVGYRELREIDSKFVESYLIPTMEDRPVLQPHIDVLTKTPAAKTMSDLPGLDILKPNAGSAPPPERTAKLLLEALTSSVGKDDVVVGSVDGGFTKISRSQFRQELRSAFEGAAEDVRLDRREGDQLGRPIELIRKAAKHVKKAIEAFKDVEHRSEFEHGQMKTATEDLDAARSALTDALSESGDP